MQTLAQPYPAPALPAPTPSGVGCRLDALGFSLGDRLFALLVLDHLDRQTRGVERLAQITRGAGDLLGEQLDGGRSEERKRIVGFGSSCCCCCCCSSLSSS